MTTVQKRPAAVQPNVKPELAEAARAFAELNQLERSLRCSILKIEKQLLRLLAEQGIEPPANGERLDYEIPIDRRRTLQFGLHRHISQFSGQERKLITYYGTETKQ